MRNILVIIPDKSRQTPGRAPRVAQRAPPHPSEKLQTLIDNICQNKEQQIMVINTDWAEFWVLNYTLRVWFSEDTAADRAGLIIINRGGYLLFCFTWP